VQRSELQIRRHPMFQAHSSLIAGEQIPRTSMVVKPTGCGHGSEVNIHLGTNLISQKFSMRIETRVEHLRLVLDPSFSNP
jgi:hypothetical protein